ncbi:MAG: hypothetical protein QM640_14480 [Niabella sp.]
MAKLLLVCCFLTLYLSPKAQVPDFISVKKKNGITIKNYYAGINISFITNDGRRYDALIDKIAHDSIFLRYFEVTQYANIFGTASKDTITTYILPVHYKDIRYILTPKVNYRNHYLGVIGKAAMAGGFGYDVLNVVNGLIAKDKPLFDNRNKRNVAIATGVGALGLYLSRKFSNPRKGNRYKIVYVHLN